MHPRNDDGPPDVIPWTGRHIQVLINRGTPSPVLRRQGPMSFGDETSTWMGDQSAAARHDGPDRRPRTADDFETLVTLLNTTPAGPVRCEVRSGIARQARAGVAGDRGER